MIALIAGEEAAGRGQIHCALVYEGFETSHVSTPDDAECLVRDHGSANCVLTIDARTLSARRGGRTWAAFLAGHPALSVVVTVCGAADDTARQATTGTNRILLENPFDAAAVLAGVRRAVEKPAPRGRRATARVRRSEDEAHRPRGSRSSTAG